MGAPGEPPTTTGKTSQSTVLGLGGAAVGQALALKGLGEKVRQGEGAGRGQGGTPGENFQA